MTFGLFDVIIIAVVVGFAVAGFMMGFITAIGSLIGLSAGWYVANAYSQAVSGWLAPHLGSYHDWAGIAAFILLFLVTAKIVGLIFWLVDRLFHIFWFIPFLRSINRMAGLVLGLIEGVLMAGFVIMAIKMLPFVAPYLQETIKQSLMANWFMLLAGGVGSQSQNLVNFVLPYLGKGTWWGK